MARSNPVADMIVAAIAHYEKHNRYIDTVELNKVRWEMFKAYIGRLDPDLDIRDEIHFKDIKVKKMSKFSLGAVKITLQKSTLAPNETTQIAHHE